MSMMKIINNQIVINSGKEDYSEICVVVPGSWQGHPAGDYEITENDIEQMLENFKNEGRDLLFDYDHESLYGKSIAAGWGKELFIRDGKLYAKVNWTPKALSLIHI